MALLVFTMLATRAEAKERDVLHARHKAVLLLHGLQHGVEECAGQVDHSLAMRADQVMVLVIGDVLVDVAASTQIRLRNQFDFLEPLQVAVDGGNGQRGILGSEVFQHLIRRHMAWTRLDHFQDCQALWCQTMPLLAQVARRLHVMPQVAPRDAEYCQGHSSRRGTIRQTTGNATPPGHPRTSFGHAQVGSLHCRQAQDDIPIGLIRGDAARSC